MKLISVKKISNNPKLMEITYETTVFFRVKTITRKVYVRESYYTYWNFVDNGDNLPFNISHSLNRIFSLIEPNQEFKI
jgi:hypothetical protein